MSRQALKWAAEQRAGDLAANAVLSVYADHATKTGRTCVDSKTIMWELETTERIVLEATNHLLARGLMKDTGERVRFVRVFQLKMPRERRSK
jgi:hypothetical protein